MSAFIKSISYYLPEQIFTNEDFYKEFPGENINRENFLKIGVEKRHIAAKNELASDMAVKSALKLFEEHAINPSEIDFLLFCAQEFDYFTPTTACNIQARLNIPPHAGALDFNLGCSGFVYGLSLAKGLIDGTGLKNVLLLTSSTLTRKVNPKDRNLRYLFGDAACATLISSDGRQSSIHRFIFGTDGNGANKIMVEDGGARNPLNESSFADISNEYGNITSKAHLAMNGVSVFSFSIKTVPRMIDELLAKHDCQQSDINLYIFHQANLFIIQTIRKKMNIDEDKIFNYMQHIGNTVSSSIPITLYEAIKAGKAKKGDRVMLLGFGVGLSWAGTIITL